jgi:hypothetical protein
MVLEPEQRIREFRVGVEESFLSALILDLVATELVTASRSPLTMTSSTSLTKAGILSRRTSYLRSIILTIVDFPTVPGPGIVPSCCHVSTIGPPRYALPGAPVRAYLRVTPSLYRLASTSLTCGPSGYTTSDSADGALVSDMQPAIRLTSPVVAVLSRDLPI